MKNNLFSILKTNTHIIIKIMFIRIKLKIKIKNGVGIYEPGGIGDYSLCRTYFKYLKRSEQFKDKKLFYFTKTSFKNIVQDLDGDLFDEIIDFDFNNIKLFKKKLKEYKINTLIFLPPLNKGNHFSIAKNRKKILNIINANKIYVDVISDHNVNIKYKNKVFPIYTIPKEFESERRRQFFEKLLNLHIPKEEKIIETTFNLKQDYICVSLVTNNAKRNYSKENWIKIVNSIIKTARNDVQIVFIGSNRDYMYTQDVIKSSIDKKRCINLCGKTDISLVPTLLKNSKFLLGPETGTVHLAHDVKCSAICLSTGSHYGRYHPYKTSVTYIYPDDFDKMLNEKNHSELIKFYEANWQYKLEDISLEKIIKVLNKHLVNTGCI